MWDEEFEIALYQLSLSVDEARRDSDCYFDDPELLELICGEWEFEE